MTMMPKTKVAVGPGPSARSFGLLFPPCTTLQPVRPRAEFVMGCAASKSAAESESTTATATKASAAMMQSKKNLMQNDDGGGNGAWSWDKTYGTNLREFERIPPATDLAYEEAALHDDEKALVANLPARQFAEERVGMRTLKGMYSRTSTQPPTPKRENQDCLMVTKLAVGPDAATALLAGVYDGHGAHGRVMSHVVARHVADGLAQKAKVIPIATRAACALPRP